MATKERVVAMVDAGMSYEDIANRLGITPGLAYLIATGMPADGSDAPAADARRRTGFLASSQHLSSPQPVVNPTTSDEVGQWVKRRVSADEAMQAAHARSRQKEQG